MQHPSDAALIERISVEAIDVPNGNAVRLSAFDALKHAVEFWSAGLLGSAAFVDVLNDAKVLTRHEFTEHSFLSIEGKKLSVLFVEAPPNVHLAFFSPPASYVVINPSGCIRFRANW